MASFSVSVSGPKRYLTGASVFIKQGKFKVQLKIASARLLERSARLPTKAQ